ncbi:asparagine synthase-related protein [Methylococcus sp. ANG]|uniref:asparagine synthase-related protein n=1 Tax=Methylococcus sp. ANG TaxID=3231903 RepID=UPI003457CDB4
MSGIIGICYQDGRSVDRTELERITDSIAHRGPDGSGIWLDGSVGLGHRMLWTTPESLKEQLPLVSSSGNFVITADARIDNRDDLARQLDLPLSVDIPDSALILAAYEAWGENCPTKLVGDFSFAIWDKRKRTIFAARDRLGIKPFYYHHREGRVFVFASEIFPLFKAAGLEKLPNRDAIREVVTKFATAFDRTLFEGIKRLPPACNLVLCNGRLVVRRYWEPVPAQGSRKPDLARHVEEFRHLFGEAVRAQSRSAFPIGCLLGGGLDSSSVLCMAARLIPDKARLTSYSMIFDRFPCDERKFIEQTAREAGVERIFTVADADPVEGWGGLKACYGLHRDWPIQGMPMRALWPLLDEAKSRGVRVMLTGVGGDSVIQGSPYYLADLLTSGRWSALAGELIQYRFSPNILWYWMMEPVLPEWLCRLGRRIKEFIRPHSDASLLLGNEALGVGQEHPYLVRARFESASAWQEASFIANPGSSMALDGEWDGLGHRGTLEFRHPFYDARLMDFLMSVPSEEKRRQGTTKYILREAMKTVLPESIRLRKGKAEFSPVFASILDSIKFDPGSFTLTRVGIVEANRVASVIEHRTVQPTPMSSLVLWQLAALEIWYSTYFKPIGDQT